MENSEEFIEYFKKIEAHLNKKEPTDSYVPFSQKIKSSKDSLIKRFKDELISYGELRNAIVHTPKIDGKPIAELHKAVVEKIKEIYKKITNPVKVIPEFQFEVLGAKEDEFINRILQEMKENSFSQFPVYDKENRVMEIINTNTISRWLSEEIQSDGSILIDEVKIKNLIPHIEFKNNYVFISRNASIYEAYDLFIKQINTKKRNLDVIFITHSGLPTENLLGLITIEDIANMV